LITGCRINNSKCSYQLCSERLLYRHQRGSQEAIAAKQIALAFTGAEQSVLTLAAEERNGESPVNSPDANQTCA
jgi:hypothetical protein